MAVNRLETPQGGTPISRFKQFRTDTSGIQQLLRKQLVGDKDKGITEAERIIFKREADKLAKDYYDRGIRPEFQGHKDDPRGTLKSHYLVSAYDTLKADAEVIGEAERLDITSRAARDASLSAKARDPYGRNTETFKATGNARTDLYQKSKYDAYNKQVLIGKEIGIKSEFNRIGVEFGKNTPEGAQAGFELLQLLKTDIAREQDEYIRGQMELSFNNESITISSIIRANEYAQELIAEEGARVDLVNSAINRVNNLTADSTMEQAIAALAQVKDLDASIRSATGGKQTAAPATVASLIETISININGIVQNAAIQHGDSAGSFATTSPEAADSLYFLIRDAGKNGIIPKAEANRLSALMDAGDITEEGERKEQFDNYRIERTVAAATQFFVRQHNLFRAWRNAAGNDPDAILAVENRIKEYTANFWGDAERGLGEAGWKNIEKRRELVERLEEEWKRIAEWSDKELNRRTKQEEQNINDLLGNESVRQDRINFVIDKDISDGIFVSDEKIGDVESYGAKSKPGSKQYYIDIAEKGDKIKNIAAHNQVLMYFVQNGTFEGAVETLLDFTQSAASVEGDPQLGNIPSHYSRTAYNSFHNQTRYYDDKNLIDMAARLQEKYLLMNEDQRTDWRLRVAGGRTINVAEVPSANAEGKPLSDYDRVAWLIENQKAQYDIASQNLQGTDMGVALDKSRGDNRVPLNEEQNEFITEIVDSYMKQNNTAEATKILKHVQGHTYIVGVPETSLERVLSAQNIVPTTPYIQEGLYTPFIEGNGPFAQIYQSLGPPLRSAGLLNSDEVQRRDAGTIRWAISAPYIQRMILAGTDEELKADIIQEYREATKDIVDPDGTVSMPNRTVNPNFMIVSEEARHYNPRNPENVHGGNDDKTQTEFKLGKYNYTDMVRIMHDVGEYKEFYVTTYDSKSGKFDGNEVVFDPNNKEHKDAINEMLSDKGSGLRVNVVNRSADYDVVEFIIGNESGINDYYFDGKDGKQLRFLLRVPMIRAKRRDVY